MVGGQWVPARNVGHGGDGIELLGDIEEEREGDAHNGGVVAGEDGAGMDGLAASTATKKRKLSTASRARCGSLSRDGLDLGTGGECGIEHGADAGAEVGGPGTGAAVEEAMAKVLTLRWNLAPELQGPMRMSRLSTRSKSQSAMEGLGRPATARMEASLPRRMAWRA